MIWIILLVCLAVGALMMYRIRERRADSRKAYEAEVIRRAEYEDWLWAQGDKLGMTGVDQNWPTPPPSTTTERAQARWAAREQKWTR